MRIVVSRSNTRTVTCALGFFAAATAACSTEALPTQSLQKTDSSSIVPIGSRSITTVASSYPDAASSGAAGGVSVRPGGSAPTTSTQATSGNAGATSSRGYAGTPSVGATPGAGSEAGGGAPAQPSSQGSGFVQKHGALRVEGGRIVDASGQPIQLRGMSLFWSQWSNYYVTSTVDQLADDWGASIVRSALGVENGGYLEKPLENEAKVVTIVDRAIARDIYVIIDWHDHHAHDHQAQAVDFFTRMARKYGSSPHVIFEIFNEPLNVQWSTVKTYAEAVLKAIRNTGAKNIVIVGTPNWSQDVDVAAKNPITAYTDVAYTLHFYAGTHKQPLRNKAKAALDAKLPLFVTEWGTCESSGNGAVSESETNVWLEFLTQHQISWANWALNDKAETCSALENGTNLAGPWRGNALTKSGALVKALIQ